MPWSLANPAGPMAFLVQGSLVGYCYLLRAVTVGRPHAPDPPHVGNTLYR